MSTAPVQGAALTFVPRRRWQMLAIVAGLFASSALWMYSRVTERSRALAAITAAGGKHQERAEEPLIDRIGRLLSGQPARGRDEALLLGPKFDDAWLAEHHDLRSLNLQEILLLDTCLSREAVLRLWGRHPLGSLIAPGIAFTDEDAAQFGADNDLDNLNLMQSEITDAGFALLRTQRLTALNIAGTRVTSGALQQQLSGTKLQFIALDGRQFTPELAAHLAKMPSITKITLIGPEVADAHLKLLETLPRPISIVIDQTSASEAAIAAVKAAHPQAQVHVFDAETTIFRWRRESLPVDGN